MESIPATMGIGIADAHRRGRIRDSPRRGLNMASTRPNMAFVGFIDGDVPTAGVANVVFIDGDVPTAARRSLDSLIGVTQWATIGLADQ